MTRHLSFGVPAIILALTTLVSLAHADNLPEPLPAIEDVAVGPRGEFLVNGEPFLPIMSWLQHPDNQWNSFENLRSLNFNTFMGNQVSSLEQANAAAAVGGYAVARPGTASDLASTLGHSHMLAYHHDDEPDLPQHIGGGNWVPRQWPSQIAPRYDQWQDQGIDRPVFVTFTSHFMEEFQGQRYTAEQQAAYYPAYVESADVVGYDLYPIYGWGRANWLNRVASGVEQLVELGDGRPVYAWIETSKGSQWMNYDLQPDVLPEHTRYQVWGSLIAGATAIGYFTHAWEPVFDEFAPTPEMQDELTRLNAQITELAPAILAGPSDWQIDIDMLAISGGAALESHFKATEHDGYVYLFAQNMDLGPEAESAGQFDPIFPRDALATIHIAGLEAGTVIEVLGDEPRLIVAEDGYFQDTFAPLGENVYRIVPEPGSAVLLLSGAMVLLRRRAGV